MPPLPPRTRATCGPLAVASDDVRATLSPARAARGAASTTSGCTVRLLTVSARRLREQRGEPRVQLIDRQGLREDGDLGDVAGVEEVAGAEPATDRAIADRGDVVVDGPARRRAVPDRATVDEEARPDAVVRAGDVVPAAVPDLRRGDVGGADPLVAGEGVEGQPAADAGHQRVRGRVAAAAALGDDVAERAGGLRCSNPRGDRDVLRLEVGAVRDPDEVVAAEA